MVCRQQQGDEGAIPSTQAELEQSHRLHFGTCTGSAASIRAGKLTENISLFLLFAVYANFPCPQGLIARSSPSTLPGNTRGKVQGVEGLRTGKHFWWGWERGLCNSQPLIKGL